MATPALSNITLHRQSRQLELVYADGNSFMLSCEYLRVFSPSAEVRGHGPGQEVLQFGKQAVAITAIKPVGNYAIQPTFDDGHDSGIYSWDYLYDLGVNYPTYWDNYLSRLVAAGKSRDAQVQVLKL